MRLFGLLVTYSVAHATLPQAPFDLDASFRTELNKKYVSSMVVLEGGDLLLSGVLRWDGDAFDRGYVRVDPSGARVFPYPDFAPGGGRITPWNERYYIGNANIVRRIWANGSLDTEFISMNLGRYFLSLQGGDYHVYPDGRVLMSGAHVLSDSTRGFEGLYSLIWFSNTGYLDTTRTHRLCNGVIYAIEEQPDGKILCTGTMTTYEGQPVSRVFRVEADGELDPSFEAEVQPLGEARDYLTLPDGRVLVGGSLRLNGSSQVRSLLRLHSNGSLDPAFELLDFEATFSASQIPFVYAIHELSPNRFVITGVFDKINGEDRGGIAMIDSSGALVLDEFNGFGCGAYDYFFSGGSTTYKSIAGFVPSNDGGYFIYGAYHGYDDGTTNDTTQRMVSKLYGLSVGVREHAEMSALRVFPNPSNGKFTVQMPDPPGVARLELIDLTGKVVRTWKWHGSSTDTSFDTEGAANGNYVLVLDSDRGRYRVPFILAP